MSTKRTRFDKIRVGERLSEVQYYEVIEIDSQNQEVVLRNERGHEVIVTHDVVEDGMYTAGQFDQEEHVSRAQLCELLEGARDSIFTVNFHRQAREKDVLAQVMSALERGESEELSQEQLVKAMRKAVRESMSGESRTLVGYLLQSEPKMGRSQVYDLSVPLGQNRLRLVDHRSLRWLILKNVKYIVR
ncbi:MAG: hypothetical protein AAGJ35_11675 [Myxococcota bacterium]